MVWFLSYTHKVIESFVIFFLISTWLRHYGEVKEVCFCAICQHYIVRRLSR